MGVQMCQDMHAYVSQHLCAVYAVPKVSITQTLFFWAKILSVMTNVFSGKAPYALFKLFWSSWLRWYACRNRVRAMFLHILSVRETTGQNPSQICPHLTVVFVQ